MKTANLSLGILLLSLAGVGKIQAQTSLDIDGATRSGTSGNYTYDTWKPMIGGGGALTSNGLLYDPIYDQQTGQGDSDFVCGQSLNNPGFFVQFGTINGVEHIAFRILLNEYKTTGNLVNIRIGFDGNNDGDVDIFMGPSLQSNQTGLVFQGTGTGLNVSPNTTTLTGAFYPTGLGTNANGNALDFTADNFSNLELSDGSTVGNGGNAVVTPNNIPTYYDGWVNQAENNGTKFDSIISFAIPLGDINAALAQISAGFTIDDDTLMRWVAFTATQNNSINQDVYGIGGTTAEWNSTYASFLPLMDSHGRPVPEPATFVSAGVLLLGAAGLGLRRRSRLARVPTV